MMVNKDYMMGKIIWFYHDNKRDMTMKEMEKLLTPEEIGEFVRIHKSGKLKEEMRKAKKRALNCTHAGTMRTNADGTRRCVLCGWINKEFNK